MEFYSSIMPKLKVILKYSFPSLNYAGQGYLRVEFYTKLHVQSTKTFLSGDLLLKAVDIL